MLEETTANKGQLVMLAISERLAMHYASQFKVYNAQISGSNSKCSRQKTGGEVSLLNCP